MEDGSWLLFYFSLLDRKEIGKNYIFFNKEENWLLKYMKCFGYVTVEVIHRLSKESDVVVWKSRLGVTLIYFIILFPTVLFEMLLLCIHAYTQTHVSMIMKITWPLIKHENFPFNLIQSTMFIWFWDKHWRKYFFYKKVKLITPCFVILLNFKA